MFINFKRTCETKAAFVPNYSFEICATDKYKTCPFYVICTKSGFVCECVSFCPPFNYFLNKDFKKFWEMTENFCLCPEKRENCARYKIRKTKQIPPENLLPDGNFLPPEK